MPHIIHIDKWEKRSHEDFYMLFVRAWIPFNAWYHKEIVPLAGKRDRDCINYIAKNPNTYKNKLIAYLSDTDRDSLRFQQELVDLHLALLHHSIPDNAAPITFKNTTIFDSNPLSEGDYYKIHYKIERTSHGSSFHYDVRVEDKVTHVAKYSHQFNNWNMADLEGDPGFSGLSLVIRNKLKAEYSRVWINAPCNIVLDPVVSADGTTKRPPHSIEYGVYDKQFFVDDKDKIAQVLIQVIYLLRCQIFHGSLDPTDQNLNVYEHAYHIQKMLIKELI